MPRKTTYITKIKQELDKLEINRKLDKKVLINKFWTEHDNPGDNYFITRSFDVHYCAAKKLLPNKEFIVKLGKIERVL